MEPNAAEDRSRNLEHDFNSDLALDYGFVTISLEDVEHGTREFESHGVDGFMRFLEEKQEQWKAVSLNVAVIGNSGVGKSSFINAISGVTADDEGAASVGVTETTTDIVAYPHPNNPMLKFWDLPGVGTPRFPKDGYLEAIQVRRVHMHHVPKLAIYLLYYCRLFVFLVSNLKTTLYLKNCIRKLDDNSFKIFHNHQQNFSNQDLTRVNDKIPNLSFSIHDVFTM